MALKGGHFKGTENVARSTGGEMPVELLATVGGGLVVFLIIAFVMWRRMLRKSVAQNATTDVDPAQGGVTEIT